MVPPSSGRHAARPAHYAAIRHGEYGNCPGRRSDTAGGRGWNSTPGPPVAVAAGRSGHCGDSSSQVQLTPRFDNFATSPAPSPWSVSERSDVSSAWLVALCVVQ